MVQLELSMKKLFFSFVFLFIITSSVYAGYQCPINTLGGQWVQISNCTLSFGPQEPNGGLWYEDRFNCTVGSRRYIGTSYNTFVSCYGASAYNCTGESIIEAPCGDCAYTGSGCGCVYTGRGCPDSVDCNDHRFNTSIKVLEYQCPCQSSEICDGLDNNCNGQIDEGFDVGASCSAGIGACLSDGAKVCSADHSGTVCNAVPGNPSPEICDGIDNNCNGDKDEGAGCEKLPGNLGADGLFCQ